MKKFIVLAVTSIAGGLIGFCIAKRKVIKAIVKGIVES